MNRFGGDASAGPSSGVFRMPDDLLLEKGGLVLPRVAPAPTANVIRVPTRREISRMDDEQRTNGKRVSRSEGGFYPLFGRENCMSVYAAEFSDRREERASRHPVKTANGFVPRWLHNVPFPPSAVLHPSTNTTARALVFSFPFRSRIVEYVLHMHSFINLRRDTASSDTRERVPWNAARKAVCDIMAAGTTRMLLIASRCVNVDRGCEVYRNYTLILSCRYANCWCRPPIIALTFVRSRIVLWKWRLQGTWVAIVPSAKIPTRNRHRSGSVSGFDDVEAMCKLWSEIGNSTSRNARIAILSRSLIHCVF